MTRRAAFWLAAALFVLTELHLLVGALGIIERLDGKGYSYRLLVNTVCMLAAPAIWWAVQRRRADRSPVPWWPCALIISSFAFDALGNQLDLYDSWDPWDNLSHFVTWFFLLWGIGLFIAKVDIRPRWALVVVVTGLGALFAVVWEIGEWYTFIRQGTELDGAYEDTLSDQLLGTLGAFCAALAVLRTVTDEGDEHPSGPDG